MHVITGLATGGAEIMLLKLLSAAKKEWEPVVVSLSDEGTIGSRIAELGIPVHCLRMKRAIPNPFRSLSMRSLMRRFRPQLIQGWMYHGNFMASIAKLLSRSSAPVLWNIRQSLYDIATERWLTAALIRLGARLSQYPAAIVYSSHTSASQHEAVGYCSTSRIVIPNGFDCQIFCPDVEARQEIRAELGLESSSILVGLIARYHPMKDHATFLRAAGLVARTYPDTRFLLVGAGVARGESALLKILGEEGLENRTLLVGKRSDMPRITAALDIACSASWAEGFSNSVGEAMACGIPCVVTDVGDSAHIVAGTGSVVPPRDFRALARAIGNLIDAGASRRRSLGMAARRRIETEFSLQASVHLYSELYRERLLGSTGGYS